MNRVFISIALVVAALGGLLIYQGAQEGTSTVMLPSELVSAAHGEVLARVRVAGRVSALPINYQVEPAIELRFSVEDPVTAAGVVPVVYRSLKPDMFAPGRDVIIDGEFSGGTLTAHRLLTQCPSKYEPPNPGEGYKG